MRKQTSILFCAALFFAVGGMAGNVWAQQPVVVDYTQSAEVTGSKDTEGEASIGGVRVFSDVVLTLKQSGTPNPSVYTTTQGGFQLYGTATLKNEGNYTINAPSITVYQASAGYTQGTPTISVTNGNFTVPKLQNSNNTVDVKDILNVVGVADGITDRLIVSENGSNLKTLYLNGATLVAAANNTNTTNPFKFTSGDGSSVEVGKACSDSSTDTRTLVATSAVEIGTEVTLGGTFNQYSDASLLFNAGSQFSGTWEAVEGATFRIMGLNAESTLTTTTNSIINVPTLMYGDSGAWTSQGTVTVGTGTVGSTLTLTGGEFRLGEELTLTGNSGIHFNGGTLIAAGNDTKISLGDGATAMITFNLVTNGGVNTIHVDADKALTISVPHTGDGFTKTGAGPLTLTGGGVYTGKINVNNGTLNTTTNNMRVVGDIWVSSKTGTPAAMRIDGGTNTFGRDLNIGYDGGSGELIIAGGTNTVIRYFEIGYLDSASGECQIEGGENRFAGGVYVGEKNGTGKLDIAGGINTIPQVFHIGYKDGTGTVNISDGTLVVGDYTQVGYSKAGSWADGELYISGGNSSFNRGIFVGELLGAQGYLEISDGTITTTEIRSGWTRATGHTRISGGDITITRILSAGKANDSASGRIDIIGSNADISCTDLEIYSGSNSLNFVIDSSGISAIEATGNAVVNGNLTVSGFCASATPDQIYTLITAGSITGSSIPASSGIWTLVNDGTHFTAYLNNQSQVGGNDISLDMLKNLTPQQLQNSGWVDLNMTDVTNFSVDFTINNATEELMEGLIDMMTVPNLLEGAILYDENNVLTGLTISGNAIDFPLETLAWDFGGFNSLYGSNLMLTALSGSSSSKDVPEPSTWALLLLGLGGLALIRRRRIAQ